MSGDGDPTLATLEEVLGDDTEAVHFRLWDGRECPTNGEPRATIVLRQPGGRSGIYQVLFSKSRAGRSDLPLTRSDWYA